MSNKVCFSGNSHDCFVLHDTNAKTDPMPVIIVFFTQGCNKNMVLTAI